MNIKQLHSNVTIPIFIIFTLLIGATPAWAEDYYVNAINGNDQNPGTLSQPWETITKANSTLKAGDTVFIRGGTYKGQQIYPKNNGTANNRITYQNYNDEIVTISDTDTPLVLSNRSYITITGSASQNIIITNCDKYLTMSNGSYNIFAYLTIGSMRNYDRFRGFNIGSNSRYNWVHHSTLYKYGEYTASNDRGDMVYIGDSSSGNNSHNLIEDNHFYSGGHNVFTVNTPYNIIRNNYMHNEVWQKGYGGRIAEIRKSVDNGSGIGSWNLIEGNRFAFTGIPPDNNYAPAVKIISHDNIVRKNMFYAAKGPALQLVTFSKVNPNPYCDNNYMFHNAFFYNGVGQTGQRGYSILFKHDTGKIEGNVIKNNIFHQNVVGNIYSLGGNTSINNWTDNESCFVDAQVDLVDSKDDDYPDFNLQDGGSCIDKGGFLTTTTSSGSGTSIPVNDSHYFFDGWDFPSYMNVNGDLIQLEGETATARVVNIDYDNNIITVDTPLTWISGQGVTLEYYDLAPDPGPIESGVYHDSTLLPPSNLRIVQK